MPHNVVKAKTTHSAQWPAITQRSYSFSWPSMSSPELGHGTASMKYIDITHSYTLVIQECVKCPQLVMSA